MVILFDLLRRMSMLTDHHGDGGFVPRELLVQHDLYRGSWFCFHLMAGSATMTGVLFLIHLTSAAAMCVGYRTRLATGVCWLLTNSLQNRNPFILDSGDRLLLLFLLWGFFCDWGSYFSMDARRQPPTEKQILNFGTIAMTVQLCTLYWLSVYWKWHPSWLEEGSALYYATHLDLFSRPLAGWLQPYPQLLAALTHFTMAAEFFGPLLVLTGVPLLILVGLGSLALLHLGIYVFMDIGIFPLVSLSYLLPFLPAAVWERSWLKLNPLLSYRPHYRDLVPALLLLLTVWWNCAATRYLRQPSWAFHMCHALKLDQYWNLFAPLPRTLDSWYVVQATTQSGRHLDLFEPRPKEFSWKLAVHTSQTFRSHRDRVYGTALEKVAGEPLRQRFIKLKAERYNREHPQDPVTVVRLYAMQSVTRLYYRYSPTEAVLLAEAALP